MMWERSPGVAIPLGMIWTGLGGDHNGRPLGFDSLTALAGILRADVSDHPDLCGDDIELFTHLFADPAKGCAAGANLLVFGNVVDDFHAGKVCGQGLSLGLFAGVLGNEDGLRLLFLLDQGFGFIK